MRLLHTSDWHLGSDLYKKDRSQEFCAYLEWLLGALTEHAVDVLIVAGDIFDVHMPPIDAEELFYRFIARVSKETPCRHVVLVAGNHDSGRQVDMPQALLAAFDVIVVGNARSNLEDEVFVLRDGAGKAELIVCAVPYLRDSDVRNLRADMACEEAERAVCEGIAAHYAAVGAIAERYRAAEGGAVPIVATGHLYVAGGRMGGDDHVRPTVGNMEGVGANVFPEVFDYVALGHLHQPQCVGKPSRIRYSGAPIAMGFDEATIAKTCVLVTFGAAGMDVASIEVPVFQRLLTVESDALESIETALEALVLRAESIWVRVRYTGESLVPQLGECVSRILKGSQVECLVIDNQRAMAQFVRGEMPEMLDMRALSPRDVFTRLLNTRGIPEAQRAELYAAYDEILSDFSV